MDSTTTTLQPSLPCPRSLPPCSALTACPPTQNAARVNIPCVHPRFKVPRARLGQLPHGAAPQGFYCSSQADKVCSGGFQRQHCVFTLEELCFSSSLWALGAEGQGVLSLKPILSRFVEKLCADLCLWCLAVVLIPVPGTQLSFHSFQRFSCLCHRHCQGKPHQWHLPALGVFTLLSCILSAQLHTEHKALRSTTAPPTLNREPPNPAFALLTQSLGSRDRHSRTDGVSCRVTALCSLCVCVGCPILMHHSLGSCSAYPKPWQSSSTRS